MTLSVARYHDLIDTAQQYIEDVFDETELDVDLENAAGVLTIGFENGSQLILSRQEALLQLWLAARSGGYHLDFDEESGRWLCESSDETLGELLARAVREQSGEAVEFEEL